jgi:hypothetical protein
MWSWDSPSEDVVVINRDCQNRDPDRNNGACGNALVNARRSAGVPIWKTGRLRLHDKEIDPNDVTAVSPTP